jgi:hypothetical protein
MPGGIRGVGGLAVKQSLKKNKLNQSVRLQHSKHDKSTDAGSRGCTSEQHGGVGSSAPIKQASALLEAESSELPEWIRCKPVGKGPRGYPIPVEVLRINLLQLQSIDQMAQTFMARLFIQLRIPNGALDSDLVRDLENSVDPPFPGDTLRPGAQWFLKQLDFPTSLDYTLLTEKVVKMKDHLDMVLKVSGSFFEQFDLHQFPFDLQRLSLTIAFNCADEGIVPICFADPSQGNAALSINLETFALSNLWILFPHLRVQRTSVDPMPNTTYPALKLSCLVERRAGFVVTNVFLPMCVLTTLSLLQFLMPGDFSSSGMRVTYSVTILLTSATYKLFVSTTLPAVGYMTRCDGYVLVCFLLQAAVVAEGAVCGALVITKADPPSPAWLPEFTTSLGDLIAFVIGCASFILYNLVFAARCLLQRRASLARVLKHFALDDARMGQGSVHRFSNYRADTGESEGREVENPMEA